MAERTSLNLLLVIAAAVPLVLASVDFVLARGNTGLRAEVDQRQRLIDQSPELKRLSRVLVRQTVVAALKNRDSKLRELLSQNGVTINASPPDDGTGG